LGGSDPYSNSKACAELVTGAFKKSFLGSSERQGIGVATARSGNVIGGGDFSKDRLLPDIFEAVINKKRVLIRNPDSIRPWQHVLEPLSGYLNLAQKLFFHGEKYSGAWNFGPEDNNAISVKELVDKYFHKWNEIVTGREEKDENRYEFDTKEHPCEANYLRLSISKAKNKLDWKPVWGIDKTLEKTIEWAKFYLEKKEIRDICIKQINEYQDLVKERNASFK
jgi:CDP-glucose 4,6-dehydratase